MFFHILIIKKKTLKNNSFIHTYIRKHDIYINLQTCLRTFERWPECLVAS